MLNFISADNKMSACGDNIALRKSLLEAVFFVRCQRQRPTVERIHHVVHRQQRFKNITQKKIEAELEAAVRRKELVATDKDGFKGYKVPAIFSYIFMCVQQTL